MSNEPFSGKVEIAKSDPNNPKLTITLDGDAGDLILRDGQGKEMLRLGRIIETVMDPHAPSPIVVADYWGLAVRTPGGSQVIRLGWRMSAGGVIDTNPEISFLLGGASTAGNITLSDMNGKNRIRLGRVAGKDGMLIVQDEKNTEVFEFEAQQATLHIGGMDNQGTIFLRDKNGKEIIHLDAGNGKIRLGGGGPGSPDGDLALYSKNATMEEVSDFDKATIHLNGQDGRIWLRAAGQPRIVLDPIYGNLRLGGGGLGAPAGDLAIYPKDASEEDTHDYNKASIHLNGQDGQMWLRKDGQTRIVLDPMYSNLRLGGGGLGAPAGDLAIYSKDASEEDTHDYDKASIHLNGQAGDILLRNADCAEEFDIAAAETIEPGTIMVLDQEGKLRQSREAYDKKVAGVISGAGDYKPGLVLDRNPAQKNRMPVALMGKAYCKVDAQYAPIDVGDLLTTSPTAGHAMKAADPLKAFGAVLGKALRPLQKGQGLIPILVALQ